ncbi:hypothetical protein GCM10009642_60490 [Nocardiopsis metallicus]
MYPRACCAPTALRLPNRPGPSAPAPDADKPVASSLPSLPFSSVEAAMQVPKLAARQYWKRTLHAEAAPYL